uniref:Uncharacterized protein n=1 Tax=Siphoviridae sp. ctt1f11 TaxID=2827959 RepID=A0A8S5SDK0_9CAUD|nr:MAG TPA: hypothetical protein [Siphoviridae sp. ctt1f11]
MGTEERNQYRWSCAPSLKSYKGGSKIFTSVNKQIKLVSVMKKLQ